jgi:hypothetical protein
MPRIALTLICLVAGAGSLKAQAAPDTIKLRNDCRLAEQALRTGHPGPKVSWARTFLPNCRPEQWASAATAALSRLRTSTDEGMLRVEWGSVHLLRDATVFTLARSIAADPTASTPARIEAIRHLAELVDPNGVYDLLTQGVPGRGRVVRPFCASGRDAGELFHFNGTPLPGDAREQIRGVGAQLRDDATAPDTVRRAGECLAYVAEHQRI